MKTSIIGAGICGLYLAWKLSEKGEEVTVFEKKADIGKEACSGLFSERILDFIPQSEKLILNQINSVFINFPKRTVRVYFSRKFLVMDHAELDRQVAILAEKSGARIILDHAVNDISQGFDRIIGCDGALSKTRDNLGLKNPNFRLGIQGSVREQNKESFVEAWPIKSGFLWKIPRGQETEYGIIGDLQNSKNILEEFLQKKNIKLENVKSALIPQGLSVPKTGLVTLCGDAAGLTKPWSGGGVVWGLVASDILLKNYPDFVKYQIELKRLFLPRIVFSDIATKVVYFFGFKIPWLLPKTVKIESDFLI